MAKPAVTWTNEELSLMHSLKEQGKTWREISKTLKNKTLDAVRKRYNRTDWARFNKDPEGYEDGFNKGKWSNEEMIQLDAYIQASQPYDFIADKLGRSITSIERQVRVTEWPAWRKLKDQKKENKNSEGEVESDDSDKENLVNAFLHVCRNELKRVESIKEEDFLGRVNLEKEKMGMPFSELKKMATNRLIEFGQGNSESIDLGKGRYVIVGDSHGKHTNKEVFSLLEQVNKELKPNKIIHIGHILDDDNDISYDWGMFRNLIILAKVEELKAIQNQRNKYSFKYEVVLDNICIGKDLYVFNQDLISDYVKTPISALDSEILEDKAIVNCHRMELTTRCSHDFNSYSASPGCICEDHIMKTIKQIDYQDGKQVKQAFPDGFIKYRRMRHMYDYWERGMLVIEVDGNGKHTLIPCQIKKTPKGIATSFFDKIITSEKVFTPNNKIFVNGDMHCDKHDVNILDIQEQICKNYKPDVQVNIGDTFNYASLNHHIMDRGGVILDKKILDESAATHFVLKRVLNWAKESHLIYGNHERFAKDFVEKYPQFGQYLDFNFMCDLENMGYILTPLKSVLKIGSVKFVHGEIKMFGQSGSKLEKTARTFGSDVFIGHIHKPEMRFGCFSIGLAGQLDQDYNEPEASNWMHGFGLCNQFMGVSFLTTIAIDNNRCTLGGKTYKPIDPESWRHKKYSARLSYDFEK